MADLGLGQGVHAPSLPTTATHKMSGEDFGAVFEAEFNPGTSQLVVGGGISDRMRHDRVIELHRRMHQVGWEKATVINMHPFELRHGMGNIGEARVPKKKDGEPYYKFVIDKYRISMRDLGDAKFIPQEVMPIEIARDVVLAFKDYGGVFCYTGTREPSDEELQEAYNLQIEFYKREYQKGLDFWARTKQLHLITDHMRNAAKELFRIGAIAQLPEWVTVTRAEAERLSCPSCGEDIKAKAKKCRFCGYFLDAEFAQSSRERYGAVAAGVQHEQPLAKQIDETQKVLESIMAEDDSDSLNQLKNLDAELSKTRVESKFTKPTKVNKA